MGTGEYEFGSPFYLKVWLTKIWLISAYSKIRFRSDSSQVRFCFARTWSVKKVRIWRRFTPPIRSVIIYG